MSSSDGSSSESREQWQRTKAIFDALQAASPEERGPLLVQRCNGDTAMMAELHSLIEACQAEEALAQTMARHSGNLQDAVWVRRSIGPYELDRLLGRGGMGAVYLAHRVDGQFRQQLAIKLIDLPLATELYRERFRLERQILAGLSHPFIAHLLDGGVSEEGELYLAMEYIEGKTISHFCNENRLSLLARLILFRNVCSAVQYAHQNLVIHRDLKPDNILVMADGTPRLLDFGTAKLLTSLPEDTEGELTQLGLRSFTPQYASPEQVLGRPISTASDIYSLGVILFQLLAEVPPYVLKQFTTEEMLRVICTEQPPTPSIVAVSEEPPDADLDAITLMALRKEPEERYLTVDQLSADVQAWLDGRPVMAQQGTRRYRASKFIRRNKLALSVAALLFTALLCGVIGVLWQSRVANVERIRAETSSKEMRELSNSFLSEIDEAVKELPGSTPVQHLLVQRVLEHLDRMPRDSARDKLTQLYLVSAYTRLGDLQGNPYEQNIGDARGALVSLDKAIGIARSLQAAYPNDPAVMMALAGALKTRSNVLLGMGRAQEAVASMKSAIEIFKRQIDGYSATPAQIEDAADSYKELGDALGLPDVASMGDYSGALIAYRNSYELSLRALKMQPLLYRAARATALYHFKVGNIEALTDPFGAIGEYRQSLAVWDRIPTSEKSDVASRRAIAYAGSELACALSDAREYSSAIQVFDQTRGTFESAAAADSTDTRAQFDLATQLESEAETNIDMLDPTLNPSSREDHNQKIEKSKALLRTSITIFQKLLEIDPSNQSWTAYLAYEKTLIGTLDQRQGRSFGGAELTTSGIAVLKESASSDNASIDVLFKATSALLTVLPLHARDVALASQYAERLTNLSHHKDPNDLVLLAQAYRLDGRIESAKEVAREGLALLPLQPPGTRSSRCRVLLEQVLVK